MYEILNNIVIYSSYFIEFIAICVILYGVLNSTVAFTKRIFKGKFSIENYIETRLRLGHTLTLALGFLVGVDIIKSAVTPNWENLGHLAAIVAIRIVLNYFLIKELDNLQAYDNKMAENK